MEYPGAVRPARERARRKLEELNSDHSAVSELAGDPISNTIPKKDYSAIKHKENIVKIKNILRLIDDPLRSMVNVDYLQKLGIDYHFMKEIESMLASLYQMVSDDRDGKEIVQDMFRASLTFRLLRQAGYLISSDVLTKFVDDKGSSKLALETDLQGLLSLYEASHLNIGEPVLDKAKEFSSKHLMSCIENLDPEVAKLVTHILKHPYHMTISRYNTRHYLDFTQTTKDAINKQLEEVAKLDFNLVQTLHKKEFREILSWWKSTGLAEELKFARNQPLKWYLWSMTMLHEPQFSKCRIETTKVIAIIYIIDDIFDIYGSPNELELFTNAVSKWEISSSCRLPAYMQACYSTLYNVTNEISQNIFKEHRWNPIDSLKKLWNTLCNAFLIESRWLQSKDIPKTDDYLRNAVITSGVPTVLMHVFFLLGQGISKENINYLERNPAIISCPATILRLWDDLGSAKDENQKGLDGSYVECYLNEHPHCSKQDVRDHVKQIISNVWKDLNKECLKRGHFSPNLLAASLNCARMVDVMYRYDDNQHLPILEDYINELLSKSL